MVKLLKHVVGSGFSPIRGFGQDRMEWRNKIHVTEANIVGEGFDDDDDDDKTTKATSECKKISK